MARTERTELMDPVTIWQSFPRLSLPQVQREKSLQLIEEVLAGDTSILVIEGDQGIGKTTLLAQFALRHPGSSVGFFADSASRTSYDPWMVQLDLCNQISWLVHGRQLERTDCLDERFFGQLVFELNRFSRRHCQVIFFIIDGLDELDSSGLSGCRQILRMLQFSHPYFRFVVSGSRDALPEEITCTRGLRSHIMYGFTRDETSSYLSGLGLSEQSIEELYRISSGNPGYLSTARRISESGQESNGCGDVGSLHALYETEWRKVDSSNESLLGALAVLAHDKRRYSLEALSRLLKVDADDLERWLKRLTFVLMDDSRTALRFVSKQFREFAAHKLRHLNLQVNRAIIDDLRSCASEHDSLRELPAYLDRVGEYHDVLAGLSPQNMTRIVTFEDSIARIREPVELGMKAASQTDNIQELMRFSVQKCVLEDMADTMNSPAELEALIATRNYSAAVKVASSQILKEDRLHMLAIVARAFSKKGLQVTPELQEQIEVLYRQIDPRILGPRGLEIAAALLYSQPKLAFELAEVAAGKLDGTSSSDWVFAALSLMAGDLQDCQMDRDAIRQELTSKIKDTEALRVSTEAAIAFDAYSGKDVIREAIGFDDVDDRIHLLRLWTKRSRRHPDAVEVSEFAVDTILNASSYAPNARVFRELCEPLPFAEDIAGARRLVDAVSGQRATAESVGPFEEYVRLQLLLTQTESRYDIHAAWERMTELYLHVASQQDVDERAAGFAWMSGGLVDIDPEGYLEKSEGLHTLVTNELHDCVNVILADSAEQFYAIRGIGRALARSKPAEAVKISARLNTQYRRELALLEVLDSHMRVADDRLDCGLLRDILKRPCLPHLKDRLILMIVERFAAMQSGSSRSVEHLVRVLPYLSAISDSAERCRGCCLVLSALLADNDNGQWSDVIRDIRNRLSESWSSIDSRWLKVDVGFRITAALSARTDAETSRGWLDKVREVQKSALLGASDIFRTQILIVKLVIRSFAGLLPQRVEEPSDLRRIEAIIDSIPSTGEQAKLWADLSLRFHACGRRDNQRKIVIERVKPLLSLASLCDQAYLTHLLVSLAPALYCAHGHTALDEIAKLPAYYRDEAWLGVCEYIFRKCPPYEPYEESTDSCYDVTYEEVIDVCSLLSLMTRDYAIYGVMEKLSGAVYLSRRRSGFTKPQRRSIADRLKKVVQDKLPDAEGIAHEGYVIASLAQVARLDPETGSQDWLNLAENARSIPNAADRTLVLGIIAEAMPARLRELRVALIDEACDLIAMIPFHLDQAGRYEALASVALGWDSSLCRRLIHRSMEIAGIHNDSPYLAAQRRLVSLAYRVDPDFAASLASAFDDDPAREVSRRNARERLELLKSRAMIASGHVSTTPPDSSRLARTAGMMLASLNAGRLATVRKDVVNRVLSSVRSEPLTKVYPVFAWAIENMTRAYADKPQASSILRPIFEGIMQAASFSEDVMMKSASGMVSMSSRLTDLSSPESMVVRHGDRESAISFIGDWLTHHAKDYIKLHDPFFGPEDLEILQLIRSSAPDCRIHVLTSLQRQNSERVGRPFSIAYSEYWHANIADQDPPSCEIMIYGYRETGQSPIHDRWWITNGSGLFSGTSFRSLGYERLSDIHVLSEEEALAREAEIDDYLVRRVPLHGGKRLDYELFTLT